MVFFAALLKKVTSGTLVQPSRKMSGLCWLAVPHIKMIFFAYMRSYVCNQRLKSVKGNYSPLLQGKQWEKKLAKHFIEMWKFSRPSSVHMKIPPMICFTCSLRKKDWFIHWYDIDLSIFSFKNLAENSKIRVNFSPKNENFIQ